MKKRTKSLKLKELEQIIGADKMEAFLADVKNDLKLRNLSEIQFTILTNEQFHKYKEREADIKALDDFSVPETPYNYFINDFLCAAIEDIEFEKLCEKYAHKRVYIKLRPIRKDKARKKEMIYKNYLEGKKEREIAVEHGVSYVNARQIISRMRRRECDKK